MAKPTAPRPARPMTPRAALRLASALAPALLASACARMEPPPGGPEDKVKPYVAMVYPGPGAVGVPRELKARIAFSEWVDPDAERKVILSPPPARRLKVEVKGNLLEVTSAAPLDSGTTYVLGVSGTVKDLHGLPLEAPFQLMFSTGPTLDSGALAGRIAFFPGSVPPAGTLAALYPEDAALRTLFSHLARRVAKPGLAAPPASSADSAPLSALPPHVFRERAAYLAPADSLGSFAFQGVRPGRYMLAAFHDADQDGQPDPGAEPMALGAARSVGATAGPKASLALAPLDTASLRLVEARWVHETPVAGLSHGTLRLRFNRLPHPRRALRRELFTVRRAGASAPSPVLDIALDPATGEVDLYTSPLLPDTGYRVACGAVPDLQGNLLDTSRDEASFAVRLDTSAAATAAAPAAGASGVAGTGATTAAGAEAGPVYLGPLKASGARDPVAREGLFPGRGLAVRVPRILTDSLQRAVSAALEARVDTTVAPLFISRVNHHELFLRFGPLPLRGQTLTLGPKAPPAPAPATAPGAPAAPAAPSAPSAPATPASPAVPAAPTLAGWPRASFTLADSARLGSLQFRQDVSAHGSLLLLRLVGTPVEILRATPPREEFTVDSLPPGRYAVGYFRDVDGDSLWTPGRALPWTAQEPFVHVADSAVVQPGTTGQGGPAGARLAFPPSW